jgi:hypothetical protein
VVRLLILFVLSVCFTCAQAQRFDVLADRRGTVYFIGTGLPGPADSCSKKLRDSGDSSDVCATPVYRGRVSFFFTGGDRHDYAAKEATPATSFSVLLRGSAKLPKHKRPTWSILNLRDRIYGDTVLLHKLQAQKLERIEYSREEIWFNKGWAALRYMDAVVMKISARQAEEIRKKLKGL